MKKSPIDELFNNLYGFYPNKAGQAYEFLVAAAFKAIMKVNVSYDQHYRGIYSESDYQIDSVIKTEQGEEMVEVKDYTINKRKVGRDDLQKMQGALTDLSFEKGIFASATDYSKPARKYSTATDKNPNQKAIDLFHIRPSTELDEKGRLKAIILKMIMVLPEYDKGQFEFAWTKDSILKFKEEDLIGKQMTMQIDKFYDKNGKLDCLLSEFTYHNQPILLDLKDDFASGCWLLPNKFIKVNDSFFEIKGIQYKIPYTRNSTTCTIKGEGNPKILIKSDDGKVDKLITDIELKNIIFSDSKEL